MKQAAQKLQEISMQPEERQGTPVNYISPKPIPGRESMEDVLELKEMA